MKKLFSLFCFLILISSLFCSCNENTQDEIVVDFVNFSQNNITLYEGQTYIVSTTIAPADAVDKSLTWKSSEPHVCAVDNGEITALSKGISIISAVSKNGVSANMRVTVKAVDDLQYISFSEIDVDLSVGQSHALSIISNPPSDSQMYTDIWSSTDEQIAVVDENGVVTALAEGSCLIIADISDVVRAVCRINAHPDLEPLVSVNVEGVPASYDTLDITGKVASTVELTSYTVDRELTQRGVTVTITVFGTKTYDKDGDDAKTALIVPMSMYMENDEHCIDVDLISRGDAVGDAVEFEYRFNAIIKPQQRQFVVYLGGREIVIE